MVIFENGKVMYKLYRKVWDEIIEYYKPSEEVYKKVLVICSKITKSKWDKEYVTLSARQSLLFRNEFSLTQHDFAYGIRQSIKKGLTLRSNGTKALQEMSFTNAKWHIARADSFRSNFLYLRKELKLNDSDGVVGATFNNIKEYLDLNSHEYKVKAKYNNFSKNSKLFYLRKKIEKLGCLVFETGTESHKISPKDVLGIFVWYETWPVIILNSMDKSHQRRIFTLLHELYHFLDTRKNSKGLDKDSIIIGRQKDESNANKFAIELLLPKEKCENVKFSELKELLDWLDNNLIKFGVSEKSQMFRLNNINPINKDLYNEWEIHYNEKVRFNLEEEEKRRKRVKDKGGGGGQPRYLVSGKTFGTTYISLVFEAYLQNKYNLTRISSFLKVRSLTVEDVFDYWL